MEAEILDIMKILSISDVAQLAWCQQKAKYLCQNKVLEYKNLHLSPKALLNDIQMNEWLSKTIYFHKNELIKINFTKFIKLFNFTIMPKKYFFSKNFRAGQIINDDFVKVDQRLEIPLEISKVVNKRYQTQFKFWRDDIVNTSYYWRDSFPVSMVQANLYSYFFNRPYKRVEFLFKDTLEKRSVFRKTDRKAAEVALNLIDTLLRNKVSAIPPKKYKCVACEFRSKCTVRNK
jgi:CRISPR/Cas system-associated exonuclease Cas4 (RecB family)